MITMDGKQVTKLELVGSDGNTVTKNLVETGTIVKPTATKQITENGTGIDVLNYSKVDVNVQASGGGFVPFFEKEFTVTEDFTSTTANSNWLVINTDEDVSGDLEIGSTTDHTKARNILSIIELNDKSLATGEKDFLKAYIPLGIVRIAETGSSIYQVVNNGGGGFIYQNVGGKPVASVANGYAPHIFMIKPTQIAFANRCSTNISARTVAGTYTLKLYEIE